MESLRVQRFIRMSPYPSQVKFCGDKGMKYDSLRVIGGKEQAIVFFEKCFFEATTTNAEAKGRSNVK